MILLMPHCFGGRQTNPSDSCWGVDISRSRKPQSSSLSKSLCPSREIIASKLAGRGMWLKVFLVDLGCVFRNRRARRQLAPAEGAVAPALKSPEKLSWILKKSLSNVCCIWICSHTSSVMCFIISDECQWFSTDKAPNNVLQNFIAFYCFHCAINKVSLCICTSAEAHLPHISPHN